MPHLITQAQPSLEFIEPAFNPWVTNVLRPLLPLWLRWRVQIPELQVKNAEVLADLYQQFQAGKIRFMLAFRHPSTNDPLCMAHLLWHEVPKVARQQGLILKSLTHAHFIYDRGIPLWAGEAVGWLCAQLGCTPIRRGKVDTQGLRSIRQLFAEGRFPMAAAPEGATNGHNEIVSPIEPGIAQFGFWCLDDLHKAGRSQSVFIVPIGIQYHYINQPWTALEQLLHQLEIDSGLKSASSLSSSTLGTLSEGDRPFTSDQEAMLYQRLYRLGEHLLTLIEQFYTKFYHQKLDFPIVSTPEASETENSNAIEPINQHLSQRLQALLNAALTVAEQFFELSPKGSITDRCRRIEQAGWDRIYREDLKQFESLSPVERGLADRVAEEASLRIWHMRLVESFVSVTGRYVIQKPTVERFAETLLLVWEMVAKITGNTVSARPKLGTQRVQMTVGEPIVVGDRWEAYQTNRRKAVADLTQDLQTALEQMIV